MEGGRLTWTNVNWNSACGPPWSTPLLIRWTASWPPAARKRELSSLLRLRKEAPLGAPGSGCRPGGHVLWCFRHQQLAGSQRRGLRGDAGCEPQPVHDRQLQGAGALRHPLQPGRRGYPGRHGSDRHGPGRGSERPHRLHAPKTVISAISRTPSWCPWRTRTPQNPPSSSST